MCQIPFFGFLAVRMLKIFGERMSFVFEWQKTACYNAKSIQINLDDAVAKRIVKVST